MGLGLGVGVGIRVAVRVSVRVRVRDHLLLLAVYLAVFGANGGAVWVLLSTDVRRSKDHSVSGAWLTGMDMNRITWGQGYIG